MKENIRKNYPQSPAYLTTFYREGIERKNKFVGLTEAVFKIYKSAYKPNPAPDQVKLLKMRRIISQQEKDTIIARMKSGINASLSLDLIKELPDFLLIDEKIESYMYASSDIAVIDDRLVHVIYFEQKENINSALYRGELYIDTENNALLRAHFEINPKYIKQATEMLVEKPKDHSPKSDLYRNIQTLQRPILHQPCPRRPLFQDKEKETTVRNFSAAYLVRDGYLQNRHKPSKPLYP